MENPKLDGPAETALSSLQDTKLSPMEEALFQSWATANNIEKPDNADDLVDYRGVYKATKGKILPYGRMEQVAKESNSEQRLLRVLKDRLLSADAKAKEDSKKQADKERQQEMQIKLGKEKTKQHVMQKAADEPGPNQLKSQQLDNDAKKLDIEKLLVARETKPDAPKS